MDTAALWHITLERLDSTPVDAVSKTWLQEALLSHTPHVDADDIDAPLTAHDPGLHFTLEVSSNLARDVIYTRWRRSLEAILAEVTGQSVTISVMYNGISEDLPERDPSRELFNRASSSTTRQSGDYAYYDSGSNRPRPLQQELQYMGGATGSLEE